MKLAFWPTANCAGSRRWDTLRASKMRKGWVVQCILLRDDAGGKCHTVYRKPNPEGDAGADVSLSLPLDNGEEK